MQYRTPNKAITVHKTRCLLVCSLACLLVVVTGCEQGPDTSNSVPTIAGTEVDLAGADWLVVNYWAEWCGPCRHEIPELNELDGAVAQAAAISVLGVNYDGLVGERLTEVSQRMGIAFAVLAGDPGARWEQPTPTVLPSTYLIAPGGEFVETLVGPQTRVGIMSRIDTLARERGN